MPVLTPSYRDVKASLEYDVVLDDIKTPNGRVIANHKVATRRDTEEVYGITPSTYPILQNHRFLAAMEEVFPEAINDSKALEHKGVVMIGIPLRTFVRPVDTGIDDLVEPFLVFGNSHGKWKEIRGCLTMKRLVCSNQLAPTMRRKSREDKQLLTLRIPHEKPQHTRCEMITAFKQNIVPFVERELQIYGKLARQRITPEVAAGYFQKLVPYPPAPAILDIEHQAEQEKKVDVIRLKLYDLFENGLGARNPSVYQTAWTAYNAITEFVDHERSFPSQAALIGEHRRFYTGTFGSSGAFKAKAQAEALSLVTAG